MVLGASWSRDQGHLCKFPFVCSQIFHIVFGFNNSTASEKKWFNFENRVTFREGQRITLTFDTYVGSTDHLVQCIYQLWDHRLQ